ncbi:hypothetical protein SynBIOSE41_01127 [Synechococcus sp. BIOS-E4-1]|nr:hypothetical protein SynBIOSE41_01127 [Synechococcus sp. BIOS-E4-1]
MIRLIECQNNWVAIHIIRTLQRESFLLRRAEIGECISSDDQHPNESRCLEPMGGRFIAFIFI